MRLGVIDFLADLVNRLLSPESRLKDFLARFYYSYYENPLYTLAESRIIKRIELLPDNSLICELSEGTKFYALPDGIISRRVKYGRASKLGKIKEFPNFGSFFMGLNEIYVERAYERQYKPKQGDIVVDAGAHLGLFTVRASKLVGRKGRVIAIEPESNLLNFLRKNVEINALENVSIVPKGVFSYQGKLRLNLAVEIGEHSLYRDILPGMHKPIGSQEIEVDTLDNILRELGIPKVDFIKMDIEGAEIEALKGMDEILKEDVKLAIAAYHFIKGKPTWKTIIPQLKGRGFLIHRVDGMIYGSKAFK